MHKHVIFFFNFVITFPLFAMETDNNAIITVENQYAQLKAQLDTNKQLDLEEQEAQFTKNPNLVSQIDARGNTPLHLAAQKNDILLIYLLLKNKADINAKNNSGLTPLHSAFVYSAIDAAETLTHNNADVTHTDMKGYTPLHRASEILYRKVNFDQLNKLMKIFISKGANINALSSWGTPLHHASGSGALNQVIFLVENGAIIDQPNSEGKTPLQLAALGSPEVVQFLLSKNIDVNKQDNDGNTPLHFAAIQNKKK